MQDLCRDHGLWLHLEGHALSGLTLVPASGSCVHGDSMTLTFGSWIGIPSVPFVTLYRFIVHIVNKIFNVLTITRVHQFFIFLPTTISKLKIILTSYFHPLQDAT